MFEYVKEELEKTSTKKYAEFNNKLCPDTKRKMLGVKIPEIRKIAKEIAKKDIRIFFNENRNEYVEDIILEGLVIAYSKMEIKEKLSLIKEFIPKIDSWIINDTFCPTLKIKNKELEEVWSFLQTYAKSEKEFEARFAIVMMLDYYINDEYVDKVIECLDKIKSEGYYAKMATAWTLAEIGVKYNEKAMKYLQSRNNLDKFTYNKTLQKMIESFRITEEQKKYLKKMKA